MKISTPFRALVVAGAFLALTACGGNRVGSESMFNQTPRPPGNFSFESPTPSPSKHVVGPTARTTSGPKATAAAPLPTFQIGIYGDSTSTPGFSPGDANIYANTIVVWTNHDSKPRSVISDAGDPASFSSPSIPPGGTFKYTVKAVGKYSYHDGTRPYDLGSFTVKSR